MQKHRPENTSARGSAFLSGRPKNRRPLPFPNSQAAEPAIKEAEQKNEAIQGEDGRSHVFQQFHRLNASCDGLSVMPGLKTGGEKTFRLLSDTFKRSAGPA